MKEYNAAFFSLFQNSFLVLRDAFDRDRALSLFTTIMEKGLKAAYGESFTKGCTKSFSEAVGERDKNVGLHVAFKELTPDSFLYEFHTDPFPLLKGELPYQLLDATYMNFKVNHLLGVGWSYETLKHLWNGDDCTQHRIFKK